MTFCDKVFSGLVRFVLRIMDTITTARSPIEIISNAFAALPSLIFSFITSVLYALFYLLTLPFRILFYILFYHPFASFIVFLLVVSVAFAVMVFLRRLSVTRLCRALWQTLAPYAYVFLRALVLLLFPQLNVIFNTLQLLFAPLIDFFSLILSLPARLTRRRSVRPASHRRGPVSPPEDSGDESTHGERLLCCVCLLREKSVLLQPCNHICLCSPCSMELFHSFNPQCPLCRTKIRSYVEVYI